MFSLDNLTSKARRHFWRRVAVAPVALCLVAGLHAVRVATYNQTPWKGGGFGMFSTVDGEASRFLRAYAVTPDGDLPIEIPERWQKRAWELRAAPTAEEATELAKKLAEMPWQYPDPLPAAPTHLVAIPAGKSPAGAIPVWEIRLECWRLGFDRSAVKLQSEKLLEVDSRQWNFTLQTIR